MAWMWRLWISIHQEYEPGMYSNKSGSSAYRQFRFECNSVNRQATCYTKVHRKRNVSTVSRWNLVANARRAECDRSHTNSYTWSQRSELTHKEFRCCKCVLQVTGSSSLRANMTRDSEKSRNTSDLMWNQQLNSNASSWQSTRSIQIQSDKLAMPNASDIGLCNRFITNRIP